MIIILALVVICVIAARNREREAHAFLQDEWAQALDWDTEIGR